MKHITQFLIIALICCLGEALRYLLPLQIPASIYGMILLFAALMLKIIKLPQIRETAVFLVEIMPLLFVPAGVGLITAVSDTLHMLGAVILAVTAVTVAVFAVTGLTAQGVIRREKRISGGDNNGNNGDNNDT